jgi:hypothetical protein
MSGWTVPSREVADMNTKCSEKLVDMSEALPIE